MEKNMANIDKMDECRRILEENCPLSDNTFVDQASYYLVGQESLSDEERNACSTAILDYIECRKNIVEFDSEYIRVARHAIEQGTWKLNERTGKKCLFYHGDMMKFDLSTGHFPILTTKKMAIKSMIGELIGFIRATDNAAEFRDLKCNFWNANANESVDWLENPNRKGTDDLGRIYGVQARDWKSPSGESVDQLKIVVDKLKKGIDDRRLIVTHWNPGELSEMALPPCHLLYSFGVRDGFLDMCMYQRSCDIPLGIPMNIASYALLLTMIAKITGLQVGVFTHFMWNIHIYEDQYEKLLTQLDRVPLTAPKIKINKAIESLEDLENLEVDDIEVIDYKSHDAIKFEFAK